jgi:uncharacterized protein
VPGVGVLIFLSVVVALVVMIHLYLWLRLVSNTGTTRRWRVTGAVALSVAAVLMVVVVLAEPVGFWVDGPLAWAGFLWLGLMFYLLITLLALEVPVLLTRLLQRARARRRKRPAAAGQPDGEPAGAESKGGADLSRRLLLRRGAAIAAGLAAAGIGGIGVARAYRVPVVRRVEVPLARLDRRADGLRIAVVADLHVGPLYGSTHVERVVDIVNGLDADLVAVVGDMVSSDVGSVRESAVPLRHLRSRYGSFFVTGNHEYYTGHEEWIEAADDLGLRVLRNERVEIVHGGGAIDLAGVNDREGVGYDDPPDYRAALGDRDTTRPVVLLAHQPVQVHRAAAYGVDLQLSGHTHGGQVYPFHYLVRLDQPVVSGLAEVDGTLVYVTNGAGFWGPPMRVGADPDVSLVTLRSR